MEWPGLTGPSVWTFEGEIKQVGAVSSNLARARGARAVVARFLWLIGFPPAALIGLGQDLARAVRRRRSARRRGT